MKSRIQNLTIPAVLALLLLSFLPAAQAEKSAPPADNPDLLALYEGDQSDRSGGAHDIDWSVVSKRDAERRARVTEIVKAGEARTATDYFHAAMVFQHGSGVEDIRWARDWAKKATELDTDPESKVHKRAKWLFAAATDRHLHRQGKPQIYGTQFLRDKGKPWTMEPFDRDAVSDEERAAHGVRSIAEQEARLETKNEELRKRGMLDEAEPE